jgi:hypothetical protein
VVKFQSKVTGAVAGVPEAALALNVCGFPNAGKIRSESPIITAVNAALRSGFFIAMFPYDECSVLIKRVFVKVS